MGRLHFLGSDRLVLALSQHLSIQLIIYSRYSPPLLPMRGVWQTCRADGCLMKDKYVA